MCTFSGEVDVLPEPIKCLLVDADGVPQLELPVCRQEITACPNLVKEAWCTAHGKKCSIPDCEWHDSAHLNDLDSKGVGTSTVDILGHCEFLRRAEVCILTFEIYGGNAVVQTYAEQFLFCYDVQIVSISGGKSFVVAGCSFSKMDGPTSSYIGGGWWVANLRSDGDTSAVVTNRWRTPYITSPWRPPPPLEYIYIYMRYYQAR